jgi:hypothetical protein
MQKKKRRQSKTDQFEQREVAAQWLGVPVELLKL